MNNFKEIQCTNVSRHINNISAHKVLEVEETESGCDVTITCTPKISNGQLKIHLYGVTTEAGQWLDFIFRYTSTGGVIGSFGYQYIGQTPPRFVPKGERTWG